MSNMMVIDYGIDKKCRLCLQPASDTDSFFSIYYEDLSLAKVFKNITSYEIVEDDRYPKNICSACRTTIVNFNNMISVFQDTEIFLKKNIFKSEVLEEIDDISNIRDESILKNDELLTELGGIDDDDNTSDVENSDLFNNEATDQLNYPENVEQNLNNTKSDHFEVKKRQNFEYAETISNNGEYKYVNTVKYSCECGDCFLYKAGFRHHMQFRHNTMLDETDLPRYAESIKLTIPTGFPNFVEFVSSKATIKRNKLKCRVCSESFSSEEEVKSHEEVHKNHVCDQCGAAFLKKSYLQDHQLMHSEDRRYVCKICNKAFKHRHTLSVHKRVHEDTKSFVCEVCGTGFRQRTTLVTHTLLKHSDVKNFPCPACNLKFNLKSTRDKHYVRKHTFNREKSFVCSKCGAAYLNKTTLTRHMGDKHLGKAKYYPCTICENKMYVMKKGLRTHMMKKHGIFE